MNYKDFTTAHQLIARINRSQAERLNTRSPYYEVSDPEIDDYEKQLDDILTTAPEYERRRLRAMMQ